MSFKRIIPCLDFQDGKVVKGINFVDIKDAGDPVQSAIAYSEDGADELVLLDISATVENRGTTLNIISKIRKEIKIPFTVGGGIRDVEGAVNVLNAGADKISIGSAGIKRPELFRELADRLGREKVVAAIDFKEEKNGESFVYIGGGREKTSWKVLDWALKVKELGAGEILLTSMNKDGTKSGYDIKTTSIVAGTTGIPVIASGGAGKKEDFLEAFVSGKADGALAAGLFHFGEVRIPELKAYLKENGVKVR